LISTIKVARMGLRFLRKFRAKRIAKAISKIELLECLNKYESVKDFLCDFRSREKPLFFFSEKNLQSFRGVMPRSGEDIVSDADEVCAHNFDILGSGKTSVDGQAGKIDWHRDFKSGVRWDPRILYYDTKIIKGNGSDIKVPWELSRFQHLPTLGKAYWLTSDERYAGEFVDEIDDWIECNPPEYGVNWTCTMDVAIRVVNWIWGYYFFKDSPKVTDEFLLKLLKSLLIHGRHIRANLEGNWSGVNGNHYLSDIVGLLYLGVMFPDFKEAKRWREFGIKELVREMEMQVYPDGVDFEASTSYHRLVLELFASAALLCKLNGIQLPESFWSRLGGMFDFTLHYLKPNGMAPQIGDNDNGRLHIFKKRQVLDHSYLLSIGAILFGDERFKVKGFDFDEEALWLFGVDGYEKYRGLPSRSKPVGSKAFENGGIYIMRHERDYMIINCAPNGQGGRGGHAHNDKMSFELSGDGEDFVVDPGTYSYTGEPRWRNRFRSISYHNTVVVDSAEQNRFEEQNLFSMHDDSKPRCIKWESDEEYDLFIGEHYGFVRLPEPITHRREIQFYKSKRLWRIRDELYPAKAIKANHRKGELNHTIEWYFHLAPSVEVEGGRNKFILSSENTKISFLNMASQLSSSVIDGWYSPGYGVKERTRVLKYTYNGRIPFACEFQIECVGKAAQC